MFLRYPRRRPALLAWHVLDPRHVLDDEALLHFFPRADSGLSVASVEKGKQHASSGPQHLSVALHYRYRHRRPFDFHESDDVELFCRLKGREICTLKPRRRGHSLASHLERLIGVIDSKIC